MFKRISIKNFRGFQDLEVSECVRFNLVVGQNNVGKTALLEAIFLHIGPKNPELSLKLPAFRGIELQEMSAESLWSSLFYRFSADEKIVLKSYDEKGNIQKLEIELGAKEKLTMNRHEEKQIKMPTMSAVTSSSPPNRIELKYIDSKQKTHIASATIEPDGLKIKNLRNPDFPGIYVLARGTGGSREDADRYSLLDVKGEQNVISEILKKIEPRLSRLSVVSSPLGSSIHGEIGIGRLLPIQLMGDGTARLLTLSLAIASATNGIVLVDEIENGMHYSIMKDVFKELISLANRYNVQIFATTHSHECLQAAYHSFETFDKKAFAIIRLDRIDDVIKATVYDWNSMSTVLETGWEVRG